MQGLAGSRTVAVNSPITRAAETIKLPSIAYLIAQLSRQVEVFRAYEASLRFEIYLFEN
jgi:hypothetical protein